MYDIDMPLLVDTGLFWLHVAHPARRLKPSGISRVGSEEYYCTIFALVCPWEAGAGAGSGGCAHMLQL